MNPNYPTQYIFPSGGLETLHVSLGGSVFTEIYETNILHQQDANIIYPDWISSERKLGYTTRLELTNLAHRIQRNQEPTDQIETTSRPYDKHNYLSVDLFYLITSDKSVPLRDSQMMFSIQI